MISKHSTAPVRGNRPPHRQSQVKHTTSNRNKHINRRHTQANSSNIHPSTRIIHRNRQNLKNRNTHTQQQSRITLTISNLLSHRPKPPLTNPRHRQHSRTAHPPSRVTHFEVNRVTRRPRLRPHHFRPHHTTTNSH